MQNIASESENNKGYSTRKLVGTNNPSFIKNMMKLFVKSADEYTCEMSLAINENNLVVINQLAHRIKPSIDILSINDMTDLIKEIEAAHTINEDLKNKINSSLTILKKICEQMNQEIIEK